MRNCPVCDWNIAQPVWEMKFIVPDGWKRPEKILWVSCDDCGMVFAEAFGSVQEDYNWYYNNKYGYGVADAEAKYRLQKRADYIAGLSRQLGKTPRVMDFGGGDSGFKDILAKHGIRDVIEIGAGSGEWVGEKASVTLASHVLEHVYDMNEAMTIISENTQDQGILLVDVPDAYLIAQEASPVLPILDFNQVHINHFRPSDMIRLAARWGFTLLNMETYRERGGVIRFFVFTKDGDFVAKRSSEVVQKNVIEKVLKLQAIGDREVIVWGCGDIALHCLTKVDLNIQYFVDSDPAYRGATIKGLPVLKRPNTDHPIVVNCSTSKKSLIKHIKSIGIQNELIIID